MTALSRVLRAAVSTLALVTFAHSALAQAADDPKVEAQIRKFIEEHPDVVIDSINKFIAGQQSKQQDAANKLVMTLEDQLVGDDATPMIGNPKGKTTIVYVLDAACGYCRKMTSAFETLVATNPDVKIIQRWVPFLTPESEYAARVAQVVFKRYRGQYAAWYKQLMSLQQPLKTETIDAISNRALGDGAADLIRADVKDGDEAATIEGKVKGNFQLTQQAQIKGTPFVYVVGAKEAGIFRGAETIDQLRAAIAKAQTATQ